MKIEIKGECTCCSYPSTETVTVEDSPMGAITIRLSNDRGVSVSVEELRRVLRVFAE